MQVYKELIPVLYFVDQGYKFQLSDFIEILEELSEIYNTSERIVMYDIEIEKYLVANNIIERNAKGSFACKDIKKVNNLLSEIEKLKSY